MVGSAIASTTYIGGYHIKCNGQSVGVLTANPDFGNPPYTFLWNTGETTQQIINKPAGMYSVTITDSSQVSNSYTFELMQPDTLSFSPEFVNYNGYNVSSYGANDGQVSLFTSGGTPPYKWVWSNGYQEYKRTSMAAGTYAFTISDANQCSITGSVTLIEPPPLQISFSNLQNPSCNSFSDGSVLLNISGGTGNYTVSWDNGSFELNPTNLSEGYNAVRIYDHGRLVSDTGITLTAPPPIVAEYNLSDYNGYNVSCVDCFNGTINTNVTGGTPPYTYNWKDNANMTTGDRNNLNGGIYTITINDVNGCQPKKEGMIALTMPNPKDWSRFGNSNIDTTEFIGSTDTSAVVFKSNNVNVLEMKNNVIKFNAQIKLMNIDTTAIFNPGKRLIGIDENGNLKSFDRSEVLQGYMSPFPGYTCIGCGCSPVIGWGKSTSIVNGVEVISTSNDIVKCPIDGNVGIGTTLPELNSKLDIYGEIAINGERLFVGYDGKIGIGTAAPTEKLQLFGGNFKVTNPSDLSNPVFFVNTTTKNVGIGTANPSQKLEINHNDPTGGIVINRSSSDLSNKSEIKFNKNGAQLAAIGSDLDNNGKNTFYIWQNNSLPPSFIINAIGKVGIGGVYPPETTTPYKLYVEGGIATREIKVTTVNQFPDYVFNETYPLITIQELDLFVKKHKHLPGIASAQEIEQNDGFELG